MAPSSCTSPGFRKQTLLLGVISLLAVALPAQEDPASAARAILEKAASHAKDRVLLAKDKEEIDNLAAASAPDAMVQYARGWILSNLGQTDEAMAAYRRVAEIGPPMAEAHYNLGVLLGESGRDAESIPQYDEAFRLDPKMTDAAYNAGQAHYNLGNYGAALAKWRITQKLSPDDFQIARKVLQSFNALSMWEEAAAARDEVIRILRDKRDPNAVNTILFCFDQLPMPGNRVFAYEFLTPPKDGTVWIFTITDLTHKKTLVKIELVRGEGTNHTLRVKGQPDKITPREFAEAPAWRDLRPVVRDWAARLVAPTAAQ